MTATEKDERESAVEAYLHQQVKAHRGDTRKMQWIGRRGAADRFVVFPFNRIFLVETKRPKGGTIRFHQHEDAQWLLSFGVRKEFLFTRHDVDNFIKRVLHGAQTPRAHEADCFCPICLWSDKP